jgi:hypothetical protein
MTYSRTVVVMICAVLSADALFAQQAPPRRPGPATSAETADVSNGWELLSQGRVDQAAAIAERVLTANPRSAAGLVLALEAELARAGALAALTRYERWLGKRTIEEPAALRSIAQRLLQEAAVQTEDASARMEALRGLAASGDAAAITELERAAAAGSSADARVLAALGNAPAVTLLIQALEKGTGNLTMIAEALGASRSKAAVAPLLARLEDPKSEVRGIAAQALGRIGDTAVVPQLKALLSDRNPFARVQAAGALYRLGDDSGQAVLQDLLSQTVPSMRLAALEAMASRPDASWQAQVRELTSSPDLEVRATAARLIAPHDPQLARSVLEPLTASENPAIRELSSQSAIEAGTADFTALRHLMRSNERLTRIRAASRVAGLTR